jgi:triacylglycerol lipase
MIQHDIRLALAQLPLSVDPKYALETRKLYQPLHQDVVSGVDVARDVAYGLHERQKLDVYRMSGARAAGIVIYVPGGGFTGGDKGAFANVGSYFAKQGLVGIAMNYRLAPEVAWPAGAEDVDRAVAWAKASADRLGADASRVFLLGHSAGASHTATFLFDPDIGGHEKVAGAILVSGASYVLRAGQVSGGSVSYFGMDASTYERRSAVNHVAGTKVPVLLAVAELDPGFLVTPTLELAVALTRAHDRCPPLLRLEGHNHFSPPSSLGTTDDELGGAISRFIKGIPGWST